MSHNPVAWFEIYVNDMPRAKAFYEAVLKQSLETLKDPTDSEESFEMQSFPSNMEEYGSSGALVKTPGVPAGGNSTIVYFACEDCAVEESRVVAAGGSVQQSKMSIGEFGFVSLIVDTEGNIVGLHSQS